MPLQAGRGSFLRRQQLQLREAADFHWHIARADRERRLQGNIGYPRHWRWRVCAPMAFVICLPPCSFPLDAIAVLSCQSYASHCTVLALEA